MSSDHCDRQSRTHRAIVQVVGRSTTDIWLCTEARHRDGVGMPDAGLHPHRDAMDKQHTHTAKAIAMCALQRSTCPHSSAIERHRQAMHKQHTEPLPSCCVPFGDPHVHKVTPSGETRQGAATAAQTHWGQSTIWRGHTRPTTSPKEGKRRGYISKEFCANADLCPLASPRVALVGVACSGTPTMATRGGARGHP